MKPRLIVARKIPPAVAARIAAEFDSPSPGGEDLDAKAALALLAAHAAEALLFTSNIKLDAGLIARLPASLRIAATCSVGHEHIDVAAAQARGLIVTNTPDVLSECTADLAFLLLLGAARRAGEYGAIMRAGWRRGYGLGEMLGTRVWGKTLGIIGMGRIGRGVAARARGFGMTILYRNRNRLPPELEQGAEFVADLRELLPRCQFLSLHAPSDPSTQSLMNAETFALLPKGAVFVNTTRGALVDEEALLAALRSGQVGAAGLDVYRNEPAFDERFLEVANVFMTPHMGSATVETRDAMGFRALDNIAAVLAGNAPIDPLWA